MCEYKRASQHPDNLVGRKCCRLSALVARVKLHAVDKSSAVVALARGVCQGASSPFGALLDDSVLQSRGKHDDAILLRVFFQEGSALRIAGRDENQAAPDQRRPSY